MRNLILCLLTATPIIAFAQSPWVREKNGGYTQINYSSISNYQSIYNKDAEGGSARLERTISDRTLSSYTEYGIFDRWTLLTSIPIKFLQAGELVQPQSTANPITSSGNLNAFGNIEIGARYKIYEKKIIASGQLKLMANSVSSQNDTGLKSGYESWSIEPMASVGIGGSNYYAFGYAGFGMRSNGYSNYGRIGIEIGMDLKKRVWFVGYIDALVSFRNGNSENTAANLQTGLYLNNQEFIAFGPKIIIEAIPERLGITLSTGGGVSNHLVPQKGSTSVGLYYKWK